MTTEIENIRAELNEKIADIALRELKELREDADWLIKTQEWLLDNDSNGAISTCHRHKGYGFVNDCVICDRTSKIKAKLIVTPTPNVEAA